MTRSDTTSSSMAVLPSRLIGGDDLMVSPDGKKFWSRSERAWVELPDSAASWDGATWVVKPATGTWQWDGTQWLSKPDTGRSEWSGSAWVKAPDDTARWSAQDNI